MGVNSAYGVGGVSLRGVGSVLGVGVGVCVSNGDTNDMGNAGLGSMGVGCGGCG